MDCVICRGPAADAEMFRTEVWRDEVWRLTVATESEVAGFAYLEPLRHVPYVTDLDGVEAATFGPTLARVSTALKEATGAEAVYLYVFGDGVPHLHVHLAPHTPGDALNTAMIRGPLREEHRPDGVTLVTSEQFPPLPPELLRPVAERVARLLSD